MEIFGAVHVIPANRAVERRHSREFHISAEIILARGAVEAFVAWHARLDCYTIADLEMLDVAARGDDDAGAFMAEDVVRRDYTCPDLAGFPEMKIGTERRNLGLAFSYALDERRLDSAVNSPADTICTDMYNAVVGSRV